MADFDADDFDIDELLDEIDSTGTKEKDKPNPSADKKSSAGGNAGSKSVRFTDTNPLTEDGGEGRDNDDFLSKLPRSQRDPPSSSLRTMFFADNQSSGGKSSSRPPLPPSTTSSRGRSTTSAGGSTDWLGIQDGRGDSRSASPSTSPPPTQRSTKPNSAPSRGSSTDRNKTAGNSSEEEDALFQDIGLPRQTRRSASKPLPQSSGGSNFPDSNKPTMIPRSRPGTGEVNPAPSQETKPLPSTLPSKPGVFSGSYLDQLGMSPPLPSDSPKTSLDLNKPTFGPSATIPKHLQHQPLPSTAALLGGVPPPGPTITIPPAQESSSGFPLIKPEPFASFSLTAPSVPQQPQHHPEHQGTTAPKKKLTKKDLGGVGTTSTLQLPSHLINEEELKAMSSSLKTLYANQLEMLEKSYKEQMNFLNEANRRKEDLLKEEMKAMQSDYEERLERLRSEIREMEISRQPQFKTSLQSQDLEALQSLSEKLNGSVGALQDLLKSGSTNELSTVHIQKSLEKMIQDNLGRNQEKMEGLEERVYGIVKSVDESVSKRFGLMNDAWRNLLGQVKTNMSEVMETAQKRNLELDSKCQSGIEKELIALEGNLKGSIDKIGNDLMERGDKNQAKVIGKLSESERILLAELSKILKLQRKTKEQTEGMTLEPIVKFLESDRDDDQRRRERLAQNIKEMRRDIKRISMENENRQESLQKFNMSAEMELKQISQSIRDLNSQLKFSVISGPENMTTQFNASMQQTQAEMEMKLLREERQALSDSMSLVNVEKRKLSEDRIELEKQKLDFQKDKDKIKNLELQLNTKIEETEEMQKKTETVRREEIHLTSEAQVKLKELEKEKAVLREKLMEAEQRLRTWEQKIRQEKLELVREREFIDKLRDQLLCPGCMKQNDSVGVIHPPPPPYILREPSSTTLLQGSLQNVNFTEEYFNSRINALSGTGGGGGDSTDLFDNYYHKLFN